MECHLRKHNEQSTESVRRCGLWLVRTLLHGHLGRLAAGLGDGRRHGWLRHLPGEATEIGCMCVMQVGKGKKGV